MRSKLAFYTIAATLLVGGFAVAADALVVSDEELLDQLADDVVEGGAEARVDGVLRWMDLSRVPVQVQSDDGTRRFEDEDGFRLADGVASALEPIDASDLEVVQRSVRVDGDSGTVSVRLRADGELHDVTFALVRSGQGWLVRRMTAR